MVVQALDMHDWYDASSNDDSFPIDEEEKTGSTASSYENNSIASENEETMVMRKMKALMFLHIWKMLTSLTRKLLAEHQRKKETVQATISGLLALLSHIY